MDTKSDSGKAFLNMSEAERKLNAKLITSFGEGFDSGWSKLGSSKIMDVALLTKAEPPCDDMHGNKVDRYKLRSIIEVPLASIESGDTEEYAKTARRCGIQAACDPVIELEYLAESQAQSSNSNVIVEPNGLTLETFDAVFAKFSEHAKPTHLIVASEYQGIGMDIVNARPGVKLIVVPNWTSDLWMLCDASDEGDRAFSMCEFRLSSIEYVSTLRWEVRSGYFVSFSNPRRAVFVKR